MIATLNFIWPSLKETEQAIEVPKDREILTAIVSRLKNAEYPSLPAVIADMDRREVNTQFANRHERK